MHLYNKKIVLTEKKETKKVKNKTQKKNSIQITIKYTSKGKQH